MLLTHGNAVKLGCISALIVLVECLLGQANSGADCRVQHIPLKHSRSEHFINVIHCRDYHHKVLQAHRSALRRLDFTTGKRVDRGELPKTSRAVALANELERLRESTWDLSSHNFRVVAK